MLLCLEVSTHPCLIQQNAGEEWEELYPRGGRFSALSSLFSAVFNLRERRIKDIQTALSRYFGPSVAAEYIEFPPQLSHKGSGKARFWQACANSQCAILREVSACNSPATFGI